MMETVERGMRTERITVTCSYRFDDSIAWSIGCDPKRRD
jgi:hypothetical protein